jgi:hypothetical protein
VFLLQNRLVIFFSYPPLNSVALIVVLNGDVVRGVDQVNGRSNGTDRRKEEGGNERLIIVDPHGTRCLG